MHLSLIWEKSDFLRTKYGFSVLYWLSEVQIPGNNKLILINLIAKPLPFSQMHIYKDLAILVFFCRLAREGKKFVTKI